MSYQLKNKYTIIEKKSKFIGYYYSVDSILDIEKILLEIKKEHSKAKHIPYAYKIGNNVKKTDDKEPSGTAGMPLYNLIEKNNLDNVLLLVVRYFGGVKLGAGPLLRAYANAANGALKNSD